MTHASRGWAGDLVPGFPDDLCLGFANTRYYRGSDPPTETLPDLDALLSWCRSSMALAPACEKSLRRTWCEAATGADAHREAIALREAIYRLFFSAAEGKKPAPADLDHLNRALSAAPSRVGVARAGATFAWRVR